MGTPLVELAGVCKRYGAQEALAPTDLSCASGATTVLIGPSGCGKSTLLRIVIGLITPDAGTVRVGGALLGPHNVRALRLRMGYVIQDGGLFPHRTARGNVSLMARHLGWEAERIDARVRELAELARLPESALDRYPAELSGGQRQRVSLMRALVLDPDLLLLDEPLAAIDPLVRAELQDDLRAIFRQLGKTVLMVTHDLAEAGFFGDTIVLLRDGRVVQVGTLNSLMEAPADPFVTRFLRAQRRVLQA